MKRSGKKTNVASVQKQLRDRGAMLQPSRVTKCSPWSQHGFTASTTSCDTRVSKNPFIFSVPYSFACPSHPLLSVSGILLSLLFSMHATFSS